MNKVTQPAVSYSEKDSKSSMTGKIINRGFYEKALIYFLLTLMGIVFLFPIYLIITTALKPEIAIFSQPPTWMFAPIWDNFVDLFTMRNFHEKIFNSLIVSLGATFFSILFGSMAAYALVRIKHRKMADLAFWFLSLRMFPPIAVVIPYYIILRNIGLLDTPWALILVYSTFNIPLTVWLMKGFFEEVPVALEEAAQLDGYGIIEIFFKVTLPLAAPGLAVCAVFSFIFSWNEFLYAFMLTSSSSQTATVAVMGFWSSEAIEWGRIMAGSVVVLIPVIIFVFIFQRFLVKGLTLGSVK